MLSGAQDSSKPRQLSGYICVVNLLLFIVMDFWFNAALLLLFHAVAGLVVETDNAVITEGVPFQV